jgi:hypothetical protein
LPNNVASREQSKGTMTKIEEAPLVGRWHISHWLQNYDDGRVVYPLGETPVGFIEYTPAGQMVCIIARDERLLFASKGQWTGTSAEKAAAYDSMIVYAGPYSVVGDEVLHHVEFSLYPNWVGGIQRRRFSLLSDQLDLVARLEEGTPEARTAVIGWHRDRKGDRATGTL